MVQATRDVIFLVVNSYRKISPNVGNFSAGSPFTVSGQCAAGGSFTRMIIGPVKGIERMINRLGEGRSLGNTALFKGPRELRSLAQRIIWLSERLAWLESQRHEFYAISP